jgi:hypothetical protein
MTRKHLGRAAAVAAVLAHNCFGYSLRLNSRKGAYGLSYYRIIVNHSDDRTAQLSLAGLRGRMSEEFTLLASLSQSSAIPIKMTLTS